jgi:hypothetical protein
MTENELASGVVSDEDLLSRILIPYVSKDAVRLVAATTGRSTGIICSTGRFEVSNPCDVSAQSMFISSTDLVISYNQLLYYTLAVAIRDGLVESLAPWSLQSFWIHQLPGVLIRRLRAETSSAVLAAECRGVLTVQDVRRYERGTHATLLSTTFDMTDAHDGAARAEVDVVLLDPRE